jgi:4-hydroxy-4-methyl-2-oxoglutarate aldolase
MARDVSAPDMIEATGFLDIPTTTLANLLGREQVMDIGIRPLWGPIPAGAAETLDD